MKKFSLAFGIVTLLVITVFPSTSHLIASTEPPTPLGVNFQFASTEPPTPSGILKVTSSSLPETSMINSRQVS